MRLEKEPHANKWALDLRCSVTWICYQEKRESWTSFFYGLDVDPKFTAFPPG